MNSKLNISWKVVLTIPDHGPKYHNGSKLFNVRTGKTFLRRIGGISGLDFFPYTLEPTNVFYNAIEAVKNENEFSGKKLPFQFKGDNSENLKSANIKIHLFGTNVVIVSVSISPVEVNGNSINFSEMQRIEHHKELYNLVNVICGLIVSGDHRNSEFNLKPKIFPCTLISSCNANEYISDALAVELLTRHKNVRLEIVEGVISKNQDHQLDDNSILIDRQGIFARIDLDEGKVIAGERKYERAQRIFELAVAVSKILSDDKYSALSISEQGAVNDLINNPNLVFINSITARKTWELLLKEFQLITLFDRYSYPTEHKQDLDSSSKYEWSDRTKWFMGLLGIVIIGVLGWFGTHLEKKVDIFSSEIVHLSFPEDTALISSIEKIYDFKWLPVKGALQYLLLIETYHQKDGKWLPRSNGWRYVTKKTKAPINLSVSSQFRWKVVARDENEKKISESQCKPFSKGVEIC